MLFSILLHARSNAQRVRLSCVVVCVLVVLANGRHCVVADNTVALCRNLSALLHPQTSCAADALTR
jgi:hypothetical protein